MKLSLKLFFLFVFVCWDYALKMTLPRMDAETLEELTTSKGGVNISLTVPLIKFCLRRCAATMP